jgi:amphi-Trp domain-containing protein
MSDVKVERKVTMSRHEAAEWVADLAKQLQGKGRVTIRLADSTVEMDVPEQLRFEAEIEVDDDEVELEVELKWSTSVPAPGRAHANGDAQA